MFRPSQKLILALVGGSVLIGATLYFSTFRLVIVETKIAPPTPKEASRGSDTIVTITVKPKGRGSRWPEGIHCHLSQILPRKTKLTVERNGQDESYPLKQFIFASYERDTQDFKVKYRLKLAEIPEGKVRLQDELQLTVTHWEQVTPYWSRPTKEEKTGKPLLIDMVVRPAGAAPPPQISRDPKIRVTTIQSRLATTGETHRSKPIDTVALLTVESGDAAKQPVWDMRKFDLWDAKGQKVETYCRASSESLFTVPQQVRVSVQWKDIPFERGPLFVRGKLILNDNWPLLVEFPIRNARGQAVTIPPSPPEQIQTVTLQPAPVESHETGTAK